MSILIFLAVLFVLILVHELGHFMVAKWTKMRVDEFGIGFPPRLLSIQKGETRYSLNLFPIGGFVKIFGEDGADAPSSPIAEGDRRSERSEAGEGGQDNKSMPSSPTPSRAFGARPKWAQALVLIAGVAMNVLLAWILFAAVFVSGVQTSVTEAEALPTAALTIIDVLPESPAGLAGVPANATVEMLSAGGDELDALTPSAFREFVLAHESEQLSLTYRLGDTLERVTVTPQSGLAENSERAVVGVGLSLVDTVSMPLPRALYESTLLTATTLRDITIGLSTLLWDAVRLDADLSAVAGPVGIVGLVGEASSFGLSALLMFTAFISLNLAIINLLPFPALDGGRLLFVFIETIKGSPINPSWVASLNTFGFILLILLMIAVTFNDITRII